MINLDLGYLSFKMSFGNFDYWEMKHGRNVVIAAWDNKPIRKQLSKAYKKDRQVGKEDIIDMVRQERDRILVESQLPICNIEGAEADDIVAAWNLFNPKDNIVGIDKDFFQLPEVFSLYNHRLEEWNYSDAIDKLPAFIQELADKNFALYQMLMGDVIDGIPRLLAKHREGKEQVQELLIAIENNRLSECLFNMFDDQIIDNAKLVLFPFYQFGDWNNRNFFEAWANEPFYSKSNYYHSSHWENFYSLINEKKQPAGFQQQELFEFLYE